MKIQKNGISLGILAYNVESTIRKVIDEVLDLDYPIYIINDFSKDNTSHVLEEYKNLKNIRIISNFKNYGAGESTRILIKEAKKDNHRYLIKIDGDGQFVLKDIKKIIKLFESGNYEFIKSNRFWENGIKGSIPKKRFFGNLLATIFLQVTTGTNKLYDPLNGLFGISTEIVDDLDTSIYPKRYGYPYFITSLAVIKNFKTFQINNTVIYEEQVSNLRSLPVLFTILKLTIYFYRKKINIKKKYGNFQRSAFFDLVFIWSFLATVFLLLILFFVYFFAETSVLRLSTILFLVLFNIIFNLIFFIISFKEEKSIRNTYVERE